MSRIDEALATANLARLMVEAGNVDAGLVLHRRAIAMEPDDWRPSLHYAGSLLNRGYIDEAQAAVQKCPAGEAYVLGILAFIAWQRGDAKAASGMFKLACRLKRGDPEMLLAHAQSTLASGNWEQGFRYHECRERRQQLGAPIPTWDGEYVDRLLVWSDEGVGDAVMFARFIPEIAKRVGRVVFGMPSSLICMLGGYDQFAETLVMDAAKSIDATAQCALMSTPLYCNARPDNLPPDPGVIRCAPVNGVFSGPGVRAIGVAWTGNQQFRRAHLRDMPLETMLGIAEDPDNQLFSMVVGERAADIAKLGAQKIIMDMSGFTASDFSATAALIREMDAVVTTCCGVAHVAGALGVPTFLCLSTLCDWRWLTEGDTTPWYPSVRIFRQQKPLEWGPVVAAVREALRAIPLKGAPTGPVASSGGWADRREAGTWH